MRLLFFLLLSSIHSTSFFVNLVYTHSDYSIHPSIHLSLSRRTSKVYITYITYILFPVRRWASAFKPPTVYIVSIVGIGFETL